jgi:hypothetical protein
MGFGKVWASGSFGKSKIKSLLSNALKRLFLIEILRGYQHLEKSVNFTYKNQNRLTKGKEQWKKSKNTKK